MKSCFSGTLCCTVIGTYHTEAEKQQKVSRHRQHEGQVSSQQQLAMQGHTCPLQHRYLEVGSTAGVLEAKFGIKPFLVATGYTVCT